VAALLGVREATRVVLVSGVTHALNVALWGIGLTLPRGARIITSVAEHNAVLRPLRHLAKWRRDLRISLLELDADGGFDEAAFARLLTEQTALVALIHASNVTGRVYDVAPLFARAKAAGAITLLDASQTMGHLPVHPHELHADLVAFTGHKGLRGPVGTGGLYVSPGIELEPVFVGGTGQLSDVYYQPEMMPMRLEAGTPNTPAIAGLTAALRWREREGEAFIRREEINAEKLREGLRAISGVQIYDDVPGARYTPVVSIRLTDLPVAATGQRLYDEYGIICRTGLHCAPLMHRALGTAPAGTVRFSLSGFTTEAEIDHALTAVRRLAVMDHLVPVTKRRPMKTEEERAGHR